VGFLDGTPRYGMYHNIHNKLAPETLVSMAGEVDRIIEGPRGAPNIRRPVIPSSLLAQLLSLRVTLGGPGSG